jgi:drug/metabolite transporter (DMT)-like permease
VAPRPPTTPAADGRAARTWTVAVILSVVSAFGWATYYPLVLGAGPSLRPSAALALPFVFGGAAYGVYTALRGRGREFLHAFVELPALVRTLVLVGLQVAVLASTYLAGPVDASLLSLFGDVVATPLLVAVWTTGRSASFVTPAFAVGLVLSVLGGTLAIAGGTGLEAIPPVGWLVVPAVPLTVAFYFVLSARAGNGHDNTPLVAQSMLGAGLICLVLTPLVPGGAGGLVALSPTVLLLVAVNGVVSFFVAPLLYFRAIAQVGFVVPPMLMTGIPVFTLVLAAAFLAFVPSPVALLGVPLAVLGGVVALRAERRVPALATATP